METYDHVEGEAIVAEKNAHAMDDGGESFPFQSWFSPARHADKRETFLI